MASARETAMRVIYDVEFNGAYSNMALKKAIPAGMERRDRAMTASLVYGVIDKKLTLDYVISKFSKLKIKKLSKYILIILRMGIYQIMFMDKIPVSAAVNESVKLARRYGHGASAGYVNGVLRSVSKESVEYPTDKTEFLSVRYSFPESMCKRWIDDFGYEFTEEMMKAFEKPPELCLRPNILKITADELVKRLGGGYARGGIAVMRAGFDVASDDMYKNGFYTVQDAAAYSAVKTLAPQAGETVIDMCAAPGGKATAMAEMMNNKGKILAFDIHEHKIDLIRKNAERLGITIIEAKLRDGREFDASYSERADKVLCDAPCSGLGIIRRKPEIKYGYDADNDLPVTQLKLLENAARYLRKGGEMVYSTCTVEKRENEEVTDGFLRDNPNFEKLYEKTFYPHTDGTDGFYVCKMKRTG